MSVLEKAKGFKIGLKTILAQVDRHCLFAEDTIVRPIKDIQYSFYLRRADVLKRYCAKLSNLLYVNV